MLCFIAVVLYSMMPLLTMQSLDVTMKMFAPLVNLCRTQ